MTVNISSAHGEIGGECACLAQRCDGGVQRQLPLGRDASIVAAFECDAEVVGQTRELSLSEGRVSANSFGDAVERLEKDRRNRLQFGGALLSVCKLGVQRGGRDFTRPQPFDQYPTVPDRHENEEQDEVHAEGRRECRREYRGLRI